MKKLKIELSQKINCEFYKVCYSRSYSLFSKNNSNIDTRNQIGKA